MTTSAATSTTHRDSTRWSWGLMALMAIGVGLAAIVPYLTFDPQTFNSATSRYQTEPLWRVIALYVHMFSAGIALLVGPFQFLRSFRNRWPRIHRVVGRVYLGLGILPGGLSALLIAPGIRGGLVGAIGISTLAVLWLWTGFMAYRAIRAGHVEEHREWMIRNYAASFAAVTLRVWLGMLIGTQIGSLQTTYGGDFDLLFTEVYRVVMWLSWVPNLLVAEYLINRRRVRQPAVRRVSVVGTATPSTAQ